MGLLVVPRQPEHYDSLVELFKATFAHSGYPVHGPPSEDRTTWPAYFTSKSATAEVRGMVAVNEANSIQVLGHVSICAPRPDSVTTQLGAEPYLISHDRVWKINRLVVHPEAQGRGIGKLLMDWVEDEGTRAGKVLILGVLGEKDLVAQQMYEKRGYEKFGTNEITGLNDRTWKQTFYIRPENQNLR